MLYDGALRFMEAGKHAMKLRDIERQNKSLKQAQKIVRELTSCLDMQNGGEIAKNLFGLYVYVNNELVSANVEDKVEPIDRSIRILSELRESWVAIEKGQIQAGQTLAA